MTIATRIGFLTALLALAPGAAVRAQTLAITGATIIDGTGKAPLADGVVVITAGRIAAVGPMGEVAIPDGAKRIDSRGKYVIPGLMDANVHLALSHNMNLEAVLRYEDRFDQIALEAAQLALKGGLTTVFDTWGPRAPLVKARDLIKRGEAPGSRIYLAGTIIGWDGVMDNFFPPGTLDQMSKPTAARLTELYGQGVGRRLRAMRPERVRLAVRDYLRKGVDFVKYYGDANDAIVFSPRLQRVIVEEGHRAGMPVQAHVTSVEGIHVAMEAGLDFLTHGDMSMPPDTIPDETLEELVRRGIASSVLPYTQRRLDALVKYAGDAATLYLSGKNNRRNMIRVGVTMLLSTDAYINAPDLLPEPIPLIADTVDSDRKIGEAHSNALVALEEEGMAPMEILKTATSNIAKAYRVDAMLGTVTPGKLADLVILDADPLASARNYRRIHTVIQEGRIVDREALPVAPIFTSAGPGVEAPKRKR